MAKKEEPENRVVAGIPEEDLPLDMDERREVVAARNAEKEKS